MPRFVIQKHAASRLHYDFRLEMGGVFRSWAIPKGPSLDPRQKRLAVPVEDHPLGWGAFEGVIDDGYGAGTVIVWDRGEYKNVTEQDGRRVSMNRAFVAGHMTLELDGNKLRGGFALMRMSGRDDGDWLLIKRRDEYANSTDILAKRPESVLSGRTIEEIEDRSHRHAA